MEPTLQLVINIGALAIAVGGIIGLPVGIVKLWPIIKRVVQLVATVEHLPETLRHQDAVMADMADEVKKAVKQVQNSHPTNLRDDVDELKDGLTSVIEKLDEHLKVTPAPTTTINVNPNQ